MRRRVRCIGSEWRTILNAYERVMPSFDSRQGDPVKITSKHLCIKNARALSQRAVAY